jgi:ATP-binding cassette subfamily B protein
MKGRTSIVIAHRLSTIASLDRIVVLKGGEIVEQGTHEQLVQAKGSYAKLWKHQSGGFIEEK